MLFKKTGFPEEGDLVFATVTSVQYNSVFVKIEDYNRQGLIHISEVSPGRIRNIRDYVKEGKMVVCKVIKIDESKGHIDLSLRRVTEMQKRSKNDERKQEQKAENIIELLASTLKESVDKVYKEISDVLLPKYEMLQYAFEDVIENGISLKSVGVPDKYADKLEVLVKEKIKPKKVTISGTLMIKSYEEEGAEFVKNALVKAQGVTDELLIKCLGAGNYSLELHDKDYKGAEAKLKLVLDSIHDSIKSSKLTSFSFKKKEKD
ncbi:S1 RNA-binding domain-containing protein [Candidatus Woesearchaeota archaeon]|nr:S1 RNA-binding domain-containing protein [Candidatus Woesearchaeota archaeon]